MALLYERGRGVVTIRTDRSRSSGMHPQSLSLCHPQERFRNCDTPQEPWEEDPQEAGGAGSARQPKSRKRRRDASQAAGTSQDPARRSNRVQELQDANAAAREAMLKAYDAFIAAARALHGDPAAEISDWAKNKSATSELDQTLFRQMRERVVFRGLGCDEAHEGGPEGGAVFCSLGAKAQEGAPHCSLSGGGEDCGEEDSVSSKDGMLEALVESLAALDMVRVPPQLQQLQQLQDEFRELYRNVFSE